MSDVVHAVPRAERRREKNDVRGPFGAVPAEQSLARIIGETVALRIAEIVPELTWTPACAVCCREAKRAERDHHVAVANAKAAAEPLPDVPQVQVSQAFTIGPDGPVCWQHVEPGPRTVTAVHMDGTPLSDEEIAEFKRAADQHFKHGE